MMLWFTSSKNREQGTDRGKDGDRKGEYQDRRQIRCQLNLLSIKLRKLFLN